MSMITIADFARAAVPMAPNWVDMGYKRYGEVFSEIFDVESMDSAMHEDIVYSGLGLPRQTTDSESTPYDSARQLWVARYMPSSFKLGLIVSAEAIDDMKGFSIMEKRAIMLGVSFKEAKDIVAHNILNRAANASYTGGDGQPLSSSSHPTRSGVVYSNQPTVGAALSEGSLEQAYIDLGSYIDERGLKTNVKPRKLVIPRASIFEAQRILGAELRTGTSDNDPNAIKDLGIIPEGVVVSNYLTSNSFWMLKTDAFPGEGLKFLNRKELDIAEDVHFDTDGVKMRGYARFVAGWTHPQSTYFGNS